MLENVSSYLRCADDQLEEWQFLRPSELERLRAALLDVNNVCVGARSHGFDAWAFISSLPKRRIPSTLDGGTAITATT